jgi:tetratricopeptide (TPR) repeat protein
LQTVSSRNLAEVLYWSGEHHEALRRFQHTLDMDPSAALVRGQMAAILSALGDPEGALEIRQEELRRAGRQEAAVELGRVYATGGEDAVYRWYLALLDQRAARRRVSPFSRAILHGALGDKDEAFRWLEEAYEARWGLLIFAKVNPWLQSLHDDPRWDDLMRRMNLG